MTDVADADRRTAEGLVAFYRGLRKSGVPDPAETGDLTSAIAAALAEERAKARGPFVSLLALCDAVGKSTHPHAAAYAAVASDIRRASEETE